MPLSTVRHAEVDVRRLLDVIEHEQPLVPCLERLLDQLDGLGLFLLHGYADARTEQGEISGQRVGSVGPYPPDDVVATGLTIAVLDRQLGLANATQPVHCYILSQRHVLALYQPITQIGEHLPAAGEVQIAGERDVPDASSGHRSRLGLRLIYLLGQLAYPAPDFPYVRSLVAVTELGNPALHVESSFRQRLCRRNPTECLRQRSQLEFRPAPG